jgi:hypothetical protein
MRGLGRRPPSGRQVPQVASCESRAWRSGSAIIPVGGLPNAMALTVRRCQPSGPSRSPKIYRTAIVTVLPWSSDPSPYRGVVRARLPYRTAKENRKVLFRFIVKQPLSAERKLPNRLRFATLTTIR